MRRATAHNSGARSGCVCTYIANSRRDLHCLRLGGGNRCGGGHGAARNCGREGWTVGRRVKITKLAAFGGERDGRTTTERGDSAAAAVTVDDKLQIEKERWVNNET